MTTKDRSTADLVVLAITVIVGVVIVLLTVALVILEFVDADGDRTEMAGVITDLVTVMIGGLIGFIGGRATIKQLNGHREVEAESEPPPTVDPG